MDMAPVQIRFQDSYALSEPAWRWLADAMAMPALLATPARDLSDIALPAAKLPDAARDKFIALLGAERVRQDHAARSAHAMGRSYSDLLHLRGGDLSRSPDAVLYPRSETDVLAVLRLCAELDIAVVPFGGGTGHAGGINPARGEHSAVVTLDMSGMAHIIAVDTRAGLAQAEAGITIAELERQLGARGMTLGYRPDDLESTLGGWIARGHVGDWLQGLRVVTPSGLLTSPSAAPDLNHLLMGSQGVFGVITAVALRIRALPTHQDDRHYLFPDFASGLAAIQAGARDAIPLARLRLSDPGETRFEQVMARAGQAVPLRQKLSDVYRRLRHFDGNAAAMGLRFAGRESETVAARKHFDALASKLGAIKLGASKPHASSAVWQMPCRRETLLDRGLGMDRVETAANWSKLPALYATVRTALDQAMRAHSPRPGARGLVLCHVSHAYADGAALTFTTIFPRKLDGDIAQAKAIRQCALGAVVAGGGSVSPAQGIGEDYLPWIEQEKGALGLEVLRGIKRTLDPAGILNPGKLIP